MMTGEPLFVWSAATCHPRARVSDVPGVGRLLVSYVERPRKGRRRRKGLFAGFLNGQRVIAETASMEMAQRELEEFAHQKLRKS